MNGAWLARPVTEQPLQQADSGRVASGRLFPSPGPTTIPPQQNTSWLLRRRRGKKKRRKEKKRGGCWETKQVALVSEGLSRFYLSHELCLTMIGWDIEEGPDYWLEPIPKTSSVCLECLHNSIKLTQNQLLAHSYPLFYFNNGLLVS